MIPDEGIGGIQDIGSLRCSLSSRVYKRMIFRERSILPFRKANVSYARQDAHVLHEILQFFDTILSSFPSIYVNKRFVVAIMLSHTACTRFAESGIEPKILQYIMGHANESVTLDVYTHLDFKQIQQKIEAVQENIKIG